MSLRYKDLAGFNRSFAIILAEKYFFTKIGNKILFEENNIIVLTIIVL